MHNCNFISSCTIMYVCSNHLHYNVLWGRYASELKGLMKKLLFSILHISMQNCKSIVAMVFECYFFITSSCIVMYVHACIIHSSCIVRNDDVSFTRNKRVNEKIILQYTFQEEVQFPCKISSPLIICFTCFDINMACIGQD